MVENDVNCRNIVDHTPSPVTLEQAYEIVSSHETKGGNLDHSKLSPLARGKKPFHGCVCSGSGN